MRLVPAVFALAYLSAQTPFDTSIAPSPEAREAAVNRGSAAVWQSLQKLRTRASLIMITAHPDDEDGGMLTYESRGKGTRVALLTLNRGEGGANAMSPEFFDALGLVRTQELLAAGRQYGVDQYFTRVIDYGFSKTMAESMAHWTRERVLYDVVRVVRMVRPLVVTSVFNGTPADGHGNHQTAGAMSQEVFRAAGDPNVFPEQIREGLRAWQPLKEYARTRAAGQVEIPQGAWDPLLGATYAQIARQGLGYQKSQNGGPSVPRTGSPPSAYQRHAPLVPAGEKEAGFFDGIDTTLAGLATLAKSGDSAFLRAGLGRVSAAVEDAVAKFSPMAPERCAPALAVGMKETMALIAAVEASGLGADAKYDVLHELAIKRAQLNSALALALGLSVAATVAPDQEPNPRMTQFFGEPETFRVAIPGQTFGVKVQALNQGGAPAALRNVSVETAHGPAWQVTPGEGRFTVRVSPDAALTRPYFTRPDIGQSYYDLADSRFLNQPLAPYPLAGWAEWTFDGAPIRVGQVVQTVKRVNGLGTVVEPLIAGPAIGVAIEPRHGIVPLDAKSFRVAVAVHSNVKGAARGAVRLDLPAGWKAEPPKAPFETAADGEERSVAFTVTPSKTVEARYEIAAVAEYNGREYREGYRTVGYAGLRPYFLYRAAKHKTAGVDVKAAAGLKIGYITGSGDDVPASMDALGVAANFLSAADVAAGDLSAYDAILLGVRTYAARPELAANNRRLLDYVNRGGVVVVQYNTPEFDRNYGPYPYVMSANPEEVTDEASKVRILAPANPVFQWPNRITEKDFEGWVEERGSKWMKSWDPRYEALLETHDEGQAPQSGGLLYAKYGKGVWVYSAYAFYRQLPEGVPGAYRIFANLISLGKNPGR